MKKFIIVLLCSLSVLVILCFCLFGLISIMAILGISPRIVNPIRWLIPDNYVGLVTVNFDVKDAPKLPIEQGYYLVKISPTSGCLQTSTEARDGIEIPSPSEFYYYLDKSRKPLKWTESDISNSERSAERNKGHLTGDKGMIWSMSGCFFVGTEEQYLHECVIKGNDYDDDSLVPGFNSIYQCPIDTTIHLNDKWSWQKQGLYYAYMGPSHYQQAVDAYTKAITLDDPKGLINTNVSAYCWRAQIYNQMGQYEKAINDCTKAISLISKNLYPNPAVACYERGHAYFELQQYPKAIDNYTKCVSSKFAFQKSALQEKEAYYHRAEAYEKLGQYQNAINDYTKSISLLSKRITLKFLFQRQEAYYHCAEDYEKLGKKDLAQQARNNYRAALQR